MTWFVYIARCADATLYVGIALDVAARLAAHDAGRGARYTRGRGPLSLLATRKCATKGDALRLELALKALSREEKTRLAESRRGLAAFALRAERAREAKTAKSANDADNADNADDKKSARSKTPKRTM
jgi:putative endonuclease